MSGARKRQINPSMVPGVRRPAVLQVRPVFDLIQQFWGCAILKSRYHLFLIFVFILSGGSCWAQIHTPLDPELLAQTLAEDDRNVDYDRREEMIPMRDGVHLFTIILIPRVKEPMPIVLNRTPYGAYKRVPAEKGPRLQDVLPFGEDIFSGAKYILAFQDVRGKYRSEGRYQMTMPLRGPLNSSEVDHSTDTYDTIEWLIKNIPGNNGRVGMMGTSYDGFLVLMALVDPHPALRVAVPINPMVDTWTGDDWFHNGAFRQMMMDFIYSQDAPHDPAATGKRDDEYELYLKGGAAGEIGRRWGLEQVAFWKNLLLHPAYDSFWQLQAMDKILADRPLKVPTLYVHGLWDQEDIYGAIAAYKATEPKDRDNNMNYLILGPWAHGGSNLDGSFLGPLKFDADTASYFRKQILLPFFEEHLRDGAPKAGTPPVLAYETGSDKWRSLESWPVSCESSCPQKMKALYLKPGSKLAFDGPAQGGTSYAEFVSDPAHPVLYTQRPIRPAYAEGSNWGTWLVQDQRNVSNRRDVLIYQSEILAEPVTLSGQPVANLFASTSGTDSDFVVKLIDVYPEKSPDEEMRGYELMIAGDIFRGRYRDTRSSPSAIHSGTVERYRWSLPAVSHTFLPGHRIMVQIQSSWFPLYDRNPQTFVDNIFWAKPEDYKKATQRIYQTGPQASFVELPVVK